MTTNLDHARRADARRNIASILDAATTCLAQDPNASLQAIAKAAGVGRMTLYGHFPSRAALIGEVASRAMADTETALAAVDIGGDPLAALDRLLTATWELTVRYGALVVAAEQALDPEELHQVHTKPVERMHRLLRRGRRTGAFRKDMPVAWQATAVQAILHAAVGAVHRDEMSLDRSGSLVTTTARAVLAATATGPTPAALQD